MALVLADRVEQVTRTTGLADLTLAEVIRGRQSFQAVTNNGDTVIYVLEDSEGVNWEIGTGTVVHGAETTLQRTTVRQSSNGGSKISLSAGTHRVFLAADAQYFDSIVTDADLAQAISDHEAEADPHPQYTTTAEASAAAPVQSVNGESGTVLLDAADVGAAPSSHVGAGGAQHADATTTVAGFMSGADKTKLDGVETGATADQSAAEVPYSNATSGLTATDVQAALDEIDGQVDTNTSNISTNTSDIAQNTSDIAQNTSDIAERTIYVGSVAELEALPSPIAGKQALVSGVPFEYIAGSWVPAANFVTPEIYDATGDGAADDTTPWVNTLAAGVNVIGKYNATYLVTEELSISDGQNIDLNQSTIDFQLVGQKIPATFASNSSIHNGRLEQNGSAGGMAVQGFQILIYGVDTKNFKSSNISLGGALGNQPAIGFYGDINNHEIDGLTFDSSSPFGQGIIYHWLCVDGTENASALNQTNHPRNIKISNIEGGTFTNAGALTSGVFLSGCYNVEICNIHLDTSERLVTVYPGDYSNEFSVTRDKAFVNDAIEIRNPSIRVANGAGIHTTGKGINSTETVPTNVTIANPKLRGNSSDSFGIFSSYTTGVKVEGTGKLWSHQYNVALGESVKKFQINGIEITEGMDRGISCGDNNTVDNEQIYIIDCRIHNNNINENALEESSGIYFENTKSAFVRGNTFGLLGGPEKQFRSVRVDGTCDDIHLAGNHTYSAAGTIAYVGDNTTPYSMNLWDDGGNTSDTANNFAGHVWYKVNAFNKKEFIFDGSSGSPASGSWVIGDRLYYRSPAAGGSVGSVVVTTGSPGTWKAFGAIDA